MADHTHNTSKLDRTPQELSRTMMTGGGIGSQERLAKIKDKIGFTLTPRSEIPQVNVVEDDFKNVRLKLVLKNNE